MFLVWQFQFLWDLVLSARDAHIKMEAVHTKIYVIKHVVCVSKMNKYQMSLIDPHDGIML